jgi:hypothetical protein
MVKLRDGLPDRLDGHRLRTEIVSPGQISKDLGWLVQVLSGSRANRRGLASCEELVHDLGAGGDHRPQLPAVDDLGGPGGSVPGQPGDLLDADPAVAQQADEGGPQLARRPAVPDLRRRTDPLEHLPDVARVQRGAEVGGEHQAGVLPAFPGREPLVRMLFLQSTQRLHRQLGRARVRRDRSVLVSPWVRTDRHTATCGGTGGRAAGSPSRST